MAKTVKSQKNKYAIIEYSCFVGEFVSVASPFVAIGIANYDKYFVQYDGTKMSIAFFMAMAVMGMAIFLISKKKHEYLQEENLSLRKDSDTLNSILRAIDEAKDGKIVLGGVDNYFNNGTYSSGWTNYGRVIGLPLILASAPNADGVVMGIVNNRVRAYHFGVKGNVFDGVPYIFKSTYSSNWGRYHIGESNFFYTKPWQPGV